MVDSDPDVAYSGASSISQERGFAWVPGTEFGQDSVAGHGTHTAGSAAGATLSIPAETVTCDTTQVLGCAGGCIDKNMAVMDDDLLSDEKETLEIADLDRLCPSFGCSGDQCLGGNKGKTLTENGGVAQGAKLAIADIFFMGAGLSSYAGTNLWDACNGAGCKIHSNSYGTDLNCSVDALDVRHDEWMYNVSYVW